MAICYMDTNNKQYKCEYEVKNSYIEVDVEYDIEDEIEAINGIKHFRTDTEFKKRDILIVDHSNKKNYLLKNAFYVRHSSVFGTPDGGTRTRFKSRIYFGHADYEKLTDLQMTPKVNKIKIFSKAINDLIGNPSLEMFNSDRVLEIKLSYENIKKEIEICKNNIKRIIIADTWNHLHSRTKHNITIDLNGYFEIELMKRENYDSTTSYVNELMVFMQLYFPDKFAIDKIYVMVDKEYYQLSLPRMEINCKEKHIGKTVEEDLLHFLNKCYKDIPYRNSKTELRNIPYIIMNTSRSVEDNFLMFYRFIECYYKKQQIPNIKKSFVSHSIKEHYARKNVLTEEEIEKYSQEIICLRNHYVHSGYFIKNSILKISFEKINQSKNPKDYTVNNTDVDWIYFRTKLLYDIAIDIIFYKMLGYEHHKFERHF